VNLAGELVDWAVRYTPDPDDTALAQRSLLDTLAVTLAAREHPIRPIADMLPAAPPAPPAGNAGVSSAPCGVPGALHPGGNAALPP
jgi:hypothetical protein